MDSVSLDTFLAAVARHFMTTAGGAIATAGYSGGATAQEIAGAGMVLFGIALSWWNKRGYHLLLDKVHEIKGDKPNMVTAPK